MKLVQEIYNHLTANQQEWPTHTLCAMRDSNGDIKFSSNTKPNILFDEHAGIYDRGSDCFINTGSELAPEFVGTKKSPEIISRATYEDFYRLFHLERLLVCSGRNVAGQHEQ